MGNVAQLALDLLINTLVLPRVGWIKDSVLLPMVGGDAFDHTHQSGTLHCAAEGTYTINLLCEILHTSTLHTSERGTRLGLRPICGQNFRKRATRARSIMPAITHNYVYSTCTNCKTWQSLQQSCAVGVAVLLAVVTAWVQTGSCGISGQCV